MKGRAPTIVLAPGAAAPEGGAAASSAQFPLPGWPLFRLGFRPFYLGAAALGPKVPHDWTKKDIEKLHNRAPISYDDVLDAHAFIHQLGADWSKLIPRAGRQSH